MKTMWIMQGLPGSGKSSRAKIIARDNFAVVLSTDDFYHDWSEPHIYKYDPTNAAANHKRNQDRCEEFMRRGVNVVIDNTNVDNRSIKPYVTMALVFGYEIKFVVCEGSYGSTHGVPEATIERMRSKLERLSVEAALAAQPL